MSPAQLCCRYENIRMENEYQFGFQGQGKIDMKQNIRIMTTIPSKSELKITMENFGP